MDTVCDMIMTEILVRLHPESIFMYRTVSKRWNRLLTSHEFQSHYAACFHRRQRSGSPRRLFGFSKYQPDQVFSPTLLNKWCCLVPTPRPPTDEISSLTLRTSSNGLVLFRRWEKPSYDETYHILNPVTRKQVPLPPPPNDPNYRWDYKYYSWGRLLGFSCDEDVHDLTPRYELVAPRKVSHGNQLAIQTYSSDTQEWRESVLVGTSEFTLQSFDSPTVVNGVFYWVEDRGLYCFLAVYDPQGGDKDSNHLQLIELPDSTDDHHHYSSFVYKHERSLMHGRSYYDFVKIWELSETELGFWRATTIRKQEWDLIHQVSLESLCLRNPSFMRIERREDESVAVVYDEEIPFNRETQKYHWPKVPLAGFIPWNSSLLRVCLGSHCFLYNMETQVLEHIVRAPQRLTNWGLHIFFEPTSFSSYLF